MVLRSKLHPDRSGTAAPVPGRVWLNEGRVFVGTGGGLLELIEYTTPEGAALASGEVLVNQA